MKFIVFALTAGFLTVQAAAPARGEAETDVRWKKLIAAAIARGGAETVTPDGGSASYVFQAQDGSYLTLTRLIPSGQKSVCAQSKDSNWVMCADWVTQKVKYGLRDANDAPWTFSDAPVKPKESVWSQLFSGLAYLIRLGGPDHSTPWRCGIRCADYYGYYGFHRFRRR